jgi:hypothetical protein
MPHRNHRVGLEYPFLTFLAETLTAPTEQAIGFSSPRAW